MVNHTHNHHLHNTDDGYKDGTIEEHSSVQLCSEEEGQSTFIS